MKFLNRGGGGGWETSFKTNIEFLSCIPVGFRIKKLFSLRIRLTHLEEPQCVIEMEAALGATKHFMGFDIKISIDHLITEYLIHQQQYCEKKGNSHINFTTFLKFDYTSS